MRGGAGRFAHRSDASVTHPGRGSDALVDLDEPDDAAPFDLPDAVVAEAGAADEAAELGEEFDLSWA